MNISLRSLMLTFIVSGLLINASAADPVPVTIGVCPGPYGDLIKRAIAPGLVAKGFAVTVREFSDYVQPNLALGSGALAANLFQHERYLTKFSKDHSLALSPVITVPTASLGIYSRKVKSLDELKAGDEVTLANDPTNLARALRLFALHKLITLKGDIDPTKASERDIAENPKGLKFRPIEAAQLPRSLDSVALSAVNGNFAIAAGIPLSSALITEQLSEDLKNLIAVRTVDADQPLAKALKEVVESEAFRTVIEDPARPFHEFQRPAWYVAKWASGDAKPGAAVPAAK
ncbi:metal ABC transporter substrate-binding protein [Planctomycetota bacterium]|nr:metal ABC transporter substrate-binding protein [Planctomycetota bacterium]